MASFTRSDRHPTSWQGYIQGNSQGTPQFKPVGDNAYLQSVDEKPSGGIWPRHPSGKKDKGGILQEPLPKLQQ